MEDREKVKASILAACQRLYGRNMLAACDGNLSQRLSDGSILITPSAQAKAFAEVSTMARIDIEDRILGGKPSSERLMHLAIYRACPRAQAVVHAHPPHAMAWSIAHPELKELPFEGLPEVILAAGSIPIVPYARPGTENMGGNLLPFLPQHRALILARHGAVTWGESLEEAVNAMERVEHTAYILFLAKQLGGISRLPDTEIELLRQMRRKIGEVTL